MYTCPKCGNQSADGVRFCPKCGAPAAQQPQTWQPPQQPQPPQQQFPQYSQPSSPAGGQQNPYASQPNMGGYRPVNNAYGMVQEAPKKKNTKVIALTVAVIVLIIALAGTLIALFVTKDKDSGSSSRSSKSDYQTSEDEETPEKTPSAPVAAGITGSWSAEFDFSEDIWEMVGDEFDFYEPFIVTLNMEVNKDGILTMEIDEDALRKSVDTYLAAMIDVAIEAAYQEAEAEGMTRAEFDKQVEEYYGISLKEYMNSLLTADMLMDEITNGNTELLRASYRYEDGKLYIAEEGEEITEDCYWDVTLNANQLTITSASDNFFGNDGPLPLVFTRK